jgi:hypothetical protein
MISGIQPQKVKYLSKELELKKPNLAGEFLITEKFDGWWVQIPFLVEKGWQAPISSAMRVIPAFEWVANYLNSTNLKPDFDCIVIAEAIIPETPFHIINGKFNRSIGDYHCKEVIFKVHDLLNANPLNSFARVSQASAFVYFANSKRITLFEEVKVLLLSEYSQKLWEHTFENITEQGGEGIIAKRGSGIYQAGKRNSNLLKLKLETTFDLLCKEVYYTVGDKGNDNMNLRLSRASGTEVTVRVGKHSDITKFEKESPVGKVVEVRCMKELLDGALREPRFSWLREDKLISEID